MNKAKIAIFHNFMDNIGGAELVTISLAKNLDADIFTTNIDFDKISKMGGDGLRIHSIGKIPINAPFRQQFALWRFRRLNLAGKFDFFIIAGDWAVSGAVNNKPNLWYVHSPIREIWDLYEYTRKRMVSPIKRPIFDIWVAINRRLSRKYIKHVDQLVCNSKNTQNRVTKYLDRKSEVVPPPTQTSEYYFKKNQGYWLSVNRLISHKRIEVQMEAFRNLPDEKLILVGCYEKSAHFQSYAKKMMSIAPPNVTFLNWVEQPQLLKLYSECKGVISTALDEDFGLTAVEAMASGKPMIAPRQGGYGETVEHMKSGILLDEVNPENLVQAILTANANLDKFQLPSQMRAEYFSTSSFIRQIQGKIEMNFS